MNGIGKINMIIEVPCRSKSHIQFEEILYQKLKL